MKEHCETAIQAAERGKSMTGNRHRILSAAFAACALAAFSAGCFAQLNGQRESLTGVKLITVHVNCSELAKEAGLDEEEIQKNLSRRLDDAGIKVVRPQVWETLPGRCRLRASITVHKPLHLEMLIYNLKVEFVQEVTLARLPQTTIDATTWERAWFAHSSRKLLAEAVPYNLMVLTDSFIKDHRQANPRDGAQPDSETADNNPAAEPASGFIASKGSDVFHKHDCRWAQNITVDNLVNYNTREGALQAGKRPCKWCNP